MNMRLFWIIAAVTALIGCSGDDGVQYEELFSLNFGYNDNEIGINLNSENMLEYGFDFDYKNNFFYISDRINNKVIKITEKGELLLIIYNPETNSILKSTDATTATGDEILFTKLYREYGLYAPEIIASDGDRNIYVVNKDPKLKKINDNQSVSEQLILKFNNNGDLLYILGIEGKGSPTPFTHITDIKIDEKNNLLLKEDFDENTLIYKFDQNGAPLKKSVINKKEIPLQKNEEDLIAIQSGAFLGYKEDELYITSQFIKENLESSLILRYETLYEKLFGYSLQNDKYQRLIMKIQQKFTDISKLSNYSDIKDLYGDNKIIARPIDDFVGIDINSNIYFIQRDISIKGKNINDFTLAEYDANGRLKKNYVINYPPDIEVTSGLLISDFGAALSYYIKGEEITFVKIK
ncbi:MAG TPA: hypothetical protein PLG34_09025 [Spirochaetota bacterium]|jgi:hypothetical protein|nr:hypothetical protein [Spirochaetota bacterium]HPY88110.1 hypothetical protein [Spirochaetota bacterium]